MTTISVPDMMCENCVKRITNALTAAELKFSVSLDTKTVLCHQFVTFFIFSPDFCTARPRCFSAKWET